MSEKPEVEEVQDEAQNRVQKFVDGYKALVEECKVDWANYPVYQTDDAGFFKLTIHSQPVDLTKLAKPSPFMQPNA